LAVILTNNCIIGSLTGVVAS